MRREGAPDFGLDRARLAERGATPYGVLLHATARPEKQWPEEHWRLLAAALGEDIDLVMPFGTDGRARARASASPRRRRGRACPSARRSIKWRG